MILKALLTNLVLCASLVAQTTTPNPADTPKSAASAAVPIDQEPSHHLIFENEYVRVFRVEVAPHAETLVHKHDRDYVFITLGDSEVENDRVGEKPARLELKDGDARFSKGGFAHKAVNLSGKPFKNVTVELKRHWELEVRVCTEPMKCERKIMVGGVEAGETTAIFTNGFITAQRHHLLPRSSLTSSYYSAKGKNFVLFVPLTDIKVNFSGTEESLRVGQVFGADGGDVDVDSGEKDARWVVIRLNMPTT